jgi:hypothetical protein
VIIVKFAPQLKPVLKHETHDQKTHGSWATGLPAGLLDAKGSLQKYFDAELIVTGNENVIERITRFDGTVRETRKRDTLDTSPFSVRNIDDAEELQRAELEYKDLQSTMLAGNYKGIKEAAYQEAIEMGLGPRQAQYYSTAMADRASIYVTRHNQIVREPFIKKTYPDLLINPAGGNQINLKEYYETRKKTMGVLAENISKSSPVVAIEEQDFLSVIGDGRFKTQYEVRESNGAYRPALRREAELAFAGVPIDTKAKERPVYGYLAMQESGISANTSSYNADRWNINNSRVGQYGNVRVALKDEVRSRTSYTLVDSLDRQVLPQPLNKVDTRSLSFAGAIEDLSPSHGGLQRQGYAEAQIFGGVKISDIKEVYAPDEFSAGRIREALSTKKVNIPVKVMETNND